MLDYGYEFATINNFHIHVVSMKVIIESRSDVSYHKFNISLLKKLKYALKSILDDLNLVNPNSMDYNVSYIIDI